MKLQWPTWATTDVSDIGNGDPNKLEPDDELRVTGWKAVKPKLQHMNWILNLLGRYVKANNQIAVKETVEYQTHVGERIVMDNTNAICVALLPELPQDGQWVEVQGAVRYTTNAVFVRGTQNIMVLGDKECELDMDDLTFRFWFEARMNMWRIGKANQEGFYNE